MVKIRTKKQVMYCAREHKFSHITVEMSYIPTTEGYRATITDYIDAETAHINEQGEEEKVPYPKQINTKNLLIPNEQINQLFAMVEPAVGKKLSRVEAEQVRHEMALLVFVQNDFIKDEQGEIIKGKTIYNLDPTEWEVYRD